MTLLLSIAITTGADLNGFYDNVIKNEMRKKKMKQKKNKRLKRKKKFSSGFEFKSMLLSSATFLYETLWISSFLLI